MINNSDTAVQYSPQAWGNARRKLVLSLLEKFKADSPVLDIGCGPGYNWDEFVTYGIDINSEAVSIANSQGIKAILGCAEQLLFEDDVFHTILMLDILEHVLEHVDDDLRILEEAKRVIKSSGLMVISIPLYPSLWSYHDQRVGHKKRYKPRELAEKIRATGLKVVYRTCWNILGLPGAVIRKFGVNIEGASNAAGPVLYLEASLASHIPILFGLSELWVVIKE
jgi:SAM-dependent methyltransferase